MMKKLLNPFVKSLMALALLWSAGAAAQLNYSEDFEDDNHGWTTSEENFSVTDQSPCAGNGAFRGNAYNFFGFFVQEAETMSPSLGVSNGMPITLQYKYKIVGYAEDPPFTGVLNEDDWGTVTVEYATSASGPWMMVETIDPSNHVESDDCAIHTATLNILAGQTVYLRFHAGQNDVDTDYYFYIDDVTATQPAAPDCSGPPAASSAVSSVTTACLNTAVSLSLLPAYVGNGLTFQWQSSTDNVNYSNVATGGNGQLYSVVQAADTWYRAIISCGASSTTSTPVHVLSNGQLCYCDVEFDSAVEPISRVQIGSINNATSAEVDATPALEDFTGTVPAANLVQGVSYPISVEGNTNGNWTDNVSVYFDFNHDGDFTDAGESFVVGELEDTDGTDGVAVTAMIAIPADAMPGATRMRVMKLYGEEVMAPCGTGEDLFFGQAEDYTVNITVPQACSAAPAAPVIAADDTTLCGTNTATLTVTTIYDQSGINIIWQSSTDGTNFTDITGATGGEYEAPSPTGSVWYRAVAICSNGNLSTPSAPIEIMVTSPVCYCDVEYTEDVEPITSVTISTFTNTSSATVNGSNMLEDFTGLDAPVLTRGASYPVSFQGNTAGDPYTNYFTIFFDWNHNGTLDDTGEMLEVGSITGSTGSDGISVTGTVIVPADAELGYTYVRVLKRYNTSPTDPCASMTYGQAEDYRVYITDTAGRDDFGLNGMSYFPNPVQDVLSLSSSNGIIEQIAVYNLLGQEVAVVKANAATASVDMSALATGTYIVKASAGDAVKTIKIIKQ